MKRTIINKLNVLGAALLMLALAACNKDRLSPIPQTVLSDAVAFSSPDRVQQQVFGVYSAMKNGQFLGGRGHVYGDVRGEDWINITGNGVTALGVWNFSLVSSDNQVENFWSTGYATINRANVVLEGIDANANSLPTNLANQYRGEVRFVRALSYFYLVNMYGRRPFTADNGASPGVPLRLTASKGAAGAALARATVAEVYNQILTDLNFAEANLPLSYSAATGGVSATDSNVVRAHRNAAIAFKTRVYLNMGRYADVITEANKIVPQNAPFVASTGVPHQLAPSILSVFRASYRTTESIFSLPMTNANPPGTQNGLGSYWTAEFALNPAGILGNAQFTANDARRTNFVTATSPIRYTKFNDDLNNYVPIIRYSEVLLNLAEALARQAAGIDARAVALLNAVHQRSDPATTLTPATKDELITMILTERRIEFLGEGLRHFDVMRLGQPFAAKGSVSAVPTSSLSYIWPIPASELLYNNLAAQNQ
jgi:hypothetical protein